MSADWLTTSMILDQMSAGRDRAWTLFVERFRDPLIRLAAKYGLDMGEAEDAAQQTLLLFHEGFKGGKYDRSRGRLSAWLFGIARFEMRRCAEKSRRRQALGLAGGAEFLPGEYPQDEDELWAETWRESVVAQALARIRREVTPQTWEAFERVQLREETAEAVAIALGITRNAVFIAKHRVLTRLRAIHRDIEDVASPVEKP